jgi:sugar/nucleoside kinase (ribokinase family)
LDEESWSYRELWCNAYSVDNNRIKNASGAGDTAVAAFLSAILNGHPSESSLKYASIAGRNSLYCHDIHDELSGWPEMTRGIEMEANTVIDLKQLKNNNISDINN